MAELTGDRLKKFLKFEKTEQIEEKEKEIAKSAKKVDTLKAKVAEEISNGEALNAELKALKAELKKM